LEKSSRDTQYENNAMITYKNQIIIAVLSFVIIASFFACASYTPASYTPQLTANVLDSIKTFITGEKPNSLAKSSDIQNCFVVFDIHEQKQGEAVLYSVENAHNDCSNLNSFQSGHEYNPDLPLKLSVKKANNVLMQYSYASGRLVITDPLPGTVLTDEENMVEDDDGSFQVIIPINPSADTLELTDTTGTYKLSIDPNILQGKTVSRIIIIGGTPTDSWFVNQPFSVSWEKLPTESPNKSVSILLLKNGQISDTLATNISDFTYSNVLTNKTPGDKYALRIISEGQPFNYTDSNTFPIKSKPVVPPVIKAIDTRGLISAIDPNPVTSGKGMMTIFGIGFDPGSSINFKNTATSKITTVNPRQVDKNGHYIVLHTPNLEVGTYILQTNQNMENWSQSIKFLEENIVIQDIPQTEINNGTTITLNGSGFPVDLNEIEVTLKDGSPLNIKSIDANGKTIVAQIPRNVEVGPNTLQVTHTFTSKNSNEYPINISKTVTKVADVPQDQTSNPDSTNTTSANPSITSAKLNLADGTVTFYGSNLESNNGYAMLVSGPQNFTINASAKDSYVKFKLPCSLLSGSYNFILRLTTISPTALYTFSNQMIPANSKFMCISVNQTPSPTVTASPTATASPLPTPIASPVPSPIISSLNPTSVLAGNQTVRINGTRFSSQGLDTITLTNSSTGRTFTLSTSSTTDTTVILFTPPSTIPAGIYIVTVTNLTTNKVSNSYEYLTITAPATTVSSPTPTPPPTLSPSPSVRPSATPSQSPSIPSSPRPSSSVTSFEPTHKGILANILYSIGDLLDKLF
jgi:hypothetical protein